MGITGVAFIFPATSSCNRSLMVLASRSQKDESNFSIKDPDSAAFTSQEDDLKYLLKLGGSVFGSAAIKYGSVLFPEITRPNILQALFMISAPVILSVILLIKKRRVD